MHEYSIDADHSKIIFYLALISIAVSTFASKGINTLNSTWPSFELTVSITAISIFGILYGLFNKFFWKLKFLNKLGIVYIPNLNGTWEGTFSSSYYDWEEEFPATLIIEQTWSKICITGKFNNSASSSYTTSIKVNGGEGIKIYYSYQNEKKTEKADEPYSDHKGYGTLLLKNNVIEGLYFNNPSNNRNYGKLNLSRKA